MISNEKINAYALKNAIAYGGKASQGSVISALFAEGMKKEEVKDYARKVSEILKKVNSLGLAEQEAEYEKLKNNVGVSERKGREGLAELPNVKGKVVMRFAPSASGPMHVGHAITCSLNFLYVKKYGGTFYLRIEDTNPENSYKDAYKLLETDAKWLTKNDASLKVVVQSDRMEIYYSYLEKLLKKGNAYVCSCDIEAFRNLILEKKACPCRTLSVKENVDRWKKMLDFKGYAEGEVVVRFKTPESAGGLAHKNPAMRDFPLARVNTHSHPRQAKKYRVWPLMNLAVVADDIELKVTHTIRGKDHRDNAMRQKLVYDVLGKENVYPEVLFHGKIHFKDMNLSTSEMREGIKAGKFKGWDDVRLPTLVALKKKGYKPEAFWKFVERIGVNETDKVIDKKEYFLLLDGFNR